MSEKKKELTTMEAAFLEHLFSEEAQGDIRTAMRMAGYSDNVSTTTVRRQLKDEIIEVTRDFMSSVGPKAAIKTLRILEDGSAAGAKTSLEAAKQILDRAGVVKPESGFNMNVPSGGLIILPAKKRPTENEDDGSDTDV